MLKIPVRRVATGLLFSLVVFVSTAPAATTHRLNVNVIQVCDDAGANCAALDPTNDANRGYVYENQVNQIWDQAGIAVDFTYSTWSNTEAQRLTLTERNQIYNGSFTSSTGTPLPSLVPGSLQIFFVNDHPGTGYNGTAGSGWIGTPLPNPNFQARAAGNAQLGIDGFTTLGRSVMANEGFTADSLSGVIAHEIGHLLGLRHVEDVASQAAGTTADPIFSLAFNTIPNLMWGSGNGPAYNNALSLTQNFTLTTEQIDASIFNGTRLEIGGVPVLTAVAIPEPSSVALFSLGIVAVVIRRRRVRQNAS